MNSGNDNVLTQNVLTQSSGKNPHLLGGANRFDC